jgi:hypothetical protein
MLKVRVCTVMKVSLMFVRSAYSISDRLVNYVGCTAVDL